MFNPNQNCTIHRVSGKTDVFGMPLPGVLVKARCSVLKLDLRDAKSSVRADTSASRGNAREMEVVGEFLLSKTTVIENDDLIEIRGHKLRVEAVSPNFDLQGNLHHYQISCSYWSVA